MPEPQVEGNWELKWTLTGTSDSVAVMPNAKIGDSDVILLDAEIGQKTIRVRYQLKDYWEGWAEMEEFPQALWGVRMKDGSEHMCGGGMCHCWNNRNAGFVWLRTMELYLSDPLSDTQNGSEAGALCFDWKA